MFRKNPVLDLVMGSRIGQGACGATVLASVLAGCWTEPLQRAPAVAPPAPAPARPPEVLASELGIVNDDGVVTPATEIPLYDGSLFGWRIKLASCDETVEVREELQLPAPGDWEPADNLRISRDRQTAFVHSYAECHDGWVAKVWSVAPSDPAGEWVLRVHVKGYAPVTFAASFVAPPAPP